MSRAAGDPTLNSARTRPTWEQVRAAAAQVTRDGSPAARRSRMWATMLEIPWTLGLAYWAARAELHCEGSAVVRVVRDPRTLHDIVLGIVGFVTGVLMALYAVSSGLGVILVVVGIPLIPILVDLPRWLRPFSRLSWSPAASFGVDPPDTFAGTPLHALVVSRGTARDRAVLLGRVAEQSALPVQVAFLHP